MTEATIEALQREVCKRFDAEYQSVTDDQKLGIAQGVRLGSLPINGLRHQPVGDTCGWYVWAGVQMSEAADFFMPLHVKHLNEWCPRIKKYLGLGAGWRFLIAEDYEDVWFDSNLLNVD